MEYDYQYKYIIVYHYMHYIPSEIVKMIVPGNLVERTLEALKLDPMILIDSIRKKGD